MPAKPSPHPEFLSLLSMFASAEKQQDERHKENRETLKEILDQAKLTNGRVTELREWRNTHVANEQATDKRLEEAEEGLKILEEERQQAKGMRRMLVILGAVLSAVSGALSGHFINKLEKFFGG